MKRRQMIMALALAGLGVAARPFGALAALRPAEGLGAHHLLRALSHPGSAARVGQAYFGAYPDEADIDHLVKALDGSLRLGRYGRQAVRERLAGAMREDFADGRTVRVQGWVLSRTEARLCGVAALCAPVA